MICYEPIHGSGRGHGVRPDGLLRAYGHPLLAVLHDALYAAWHFDGMLRLFLAETDGEVVRDGYELGARRIRLLEEIEAPQVTVEQRVRYAILCASGFLSNRGEYDECWMAWAANWLAGIDRSESAAWKAARDGLEMAVTVWSSASAGYLASSRNGTSSWAAAKVALVSSGDVELISLAETAIKR